MELNRWSHVVWNFSKKLCSSVSSLVDSMHSGLGEGSTFLESAWYGETRGGIPSHAICTSPWAARSTCNLRLHFELETGLRALSSVVFLHGIVVLFASCYLSDFLKDVDSRGPSTDRVLVLSCAIRQTTAGARSNKKCKQLHEDGGLSLVNYLN
ncbi:hypothetical protein AAC387_Pa11g0542 [Persea americana]